MPYKSEKIKLGDKYDRRIKLNDEQRSEIIELRNKLAKQFNVSKSLIINICNPDIAEKKRLAFIKRQREGRYKPTKEEWNETMREHRKYKQKLYKEGKIQ